MRIVSAEEPLTLFVQGKTIPIDTLSIPQAGQQADAFHILMSLVQSKSEGDDQ